MAPHDLDLWSCARGSLSFPEQLRAEAHLRECAECREALAAARLAQTTMDHARGASIPVKWSAVDAIVGREAERRLGRRFGALRWMFGAGAVVSGAAAAWVLVLHPLKTVDHSAVQTARIDVRTLPAPTPVPAAMPSLTPEEVSTVESTQEALRWTDDGKRLSLEKGQRVVAGEGVKTGRRGNVVLLMPDSSRVRLSDSTEMLVRRSTRDDIALVLGTGRMTARATHVVRREFKVQAGSVVIHIVGTVFSVEANEREVDVAVAEGKVKIDLAGGGERFVSAGQSLRILANQVRAGGLSAVELSEFKRMGVDLAVKLAPRPAAVPTSVPPSSVPVDPQPEPVPDPVVVPAPRPPVTAAPPLPTTVEEIFLQRAEQSLRTGKCEAVVPGLGELAERAEEPETKSRARIIRARCYDDRLKPLEARHEYKRYLDEFPSGPYAAEARTALEE